MYGYYYETNILFFLRLAKYLHNQDPAALEKILNEMPEFDQYFSDDYCERITYAICSQVVFTDEDVMDEYTGEAIQISTWFSPDCYDPIAFGNALVDMLLFLQQENERLEGLLNEAKIREEVA